MNGLTMKARPAGIQDLVDFYVNQVSRIHNEAPGAPSTLIIPLRKTAAKLAKAKLGLRNKRILRVLSNGAAA